MNFAAPRGFARRGPSVPCRGLRAGGCRCRRGCQPGSGLGGSRSRREGVDVVDAVVTPPVDEEGRRARDSALVGARDVLTDSSRVLAPAQFVGEAVGVEVELLGVAGEVPGRKLALVAEQSVVHLPELALGGGRLGCLGGQLSPRVDIVERKVSPDVAHVGAERGQQLADHLLGMPAVCAFEVSVLDQCHGRVIGPANMIPVGVDVVREIEDVLRGSADLRARTVLGSRLMALVAAHPINGARTTEPSAPSLASSSRSPVKARLEISSETVKPIPAQAPPAASTGPLTGERGPWRAGREASHVPPQMPTGLPSTYPTMIPSVIGDAIASPSSLLLRWMPALANANSGTIT